MYDAHFGLKDLPFRIVPDLRYYLDAAPFREAIGVLLSGLDRGDAFLMLIGDAGAGKTTVVRKLLSEVDRERFAVGQMSNPVLGGYELLRSVASAFGLRASDPTYPGGALEHFLERLASERREALLVVDEAQDLDPDALRRLAELALARAGGAGGFHVCLVGPRPPQGLVELERLGEALSIATACRLRPLDAAETRQYILHRLHQAGWTGHPVFGDAAIEAIHARCKGIPARINSLSSRVLLALYVEGASEVRAELVGAVHEQLTGQFPPTELRLATAPAGAAPAPAPAPAPARVPAPVDAPAPSASVRAVAAPPPPGGTTPNAAPAASPAAAASDPAAVGTAPRAAGHGSRGFAVEDFPVLHTLRRNAPSPSVAARPASNRAGPATPDDPPEPATAAEGAATGLAAVDLPATTALALVDRRVSLASSAARPGVFVPRRWLLSAAVVVLAVAGVGLVWKSLQTMEGGAVVGARSHDVGAEAGAGGEVSRAAAGVGIGIGASPTVAATARPVPPTAADPATNSDALSLPPAPGGATASVPPPEARPEAAPAERRPVAPTADGTRPMRAGAGVKAGAGRAAVAPLLQVAPETAPPTAAGPAIPHSRRPAQDDPAVATDTPPAAMSCSAAAQTMGLCARQAGDPAARDAAAPAVRTTPPCEPSRSALGLCGDR